MLELPVQISRRSFALDTSVGNCFKKPIAFFHSCREDPRKDLVCFSIIDFERSEFIFVDCFSIDNRKALDRHPYSIRLSNHSTPHSIIEVSAADEYLLFFEFCSVIYYFSLKRGIFRILTEDDIPQLKEVGKVHFFGCTLYKDPEDLSWFFFPVFSKENSNSCFFFRAKLDLSEFQKISVYANAESVPHVTRRYKDSLLNSNFEWAHFLDEKTGDSIRTGCKDLIWRLLGPLYAEYCESHGMPSSRANFDLMISTTNTFLGTSSNQPSMNTYAAFRQFYVAKYGNYEEICLRNSITLIQEGKLNVISLNDGKNRSYYAQAANCAHFEIDERTDSIYLSNHNFARNPETVFFGPGSIDKYRYLDGELILENSFSHPTAFRLTSHRVMELSGESYLVTIGHPNRLFVIDTKTMLPIHIEDIGKPVIPTIPDLKKHLNDNPNSLSPFSFVPVEVGENGMIMCIGQKSIVFYDFMKKTIVAHLQHLPSNDHSIYSVHCQYL